jgi:DNA-binding NtrC family response regulator
MSARGILIADGDTKQRSEMAEYFSRQGYQVETTNSAVHAFCTILQKKTPVLLLGSDFDQKMSSAEMVNLLKMCNRQLAIILVSEQMLLPQSVKIREGGIFYQALRPESMDDRKEIRQAVECAFDKINRTSRKDRPVNS